VPGSIDENYALDSWKQTMDVNLNSTFWCARACAKWFKKAAESGVKASFIATTSISARIVNVPYDQPAYNSSKAGVVHFCRSIARDWRNFARVNCISPGFFDTACVHFSLLRPVLNSSVCPSPRRAARALVELDLPKSLTLSLSLPPSRSMGPSDAEVEKVVERLSVFGRPGNVKELKAAYLVRLSSLLASRSSRSS